MKIGLLGTGFGIAHARIYHARPDVSGVVVFGRTPAKLRGFADEFGFATTTDIDTIYDDPDIDLVDVCLPTPLHAAHAVRAVQTGKHVLCELPLASTMADAQRVVDAAAVSDRQVFVDMSGRFDPGSEFLHRSLTGGTYGTLKTLHVATRSALLWEGYQIRLDSIAMDVMHGSLDTFVTALGRPDSTIALGVPGKDTGGADRASRDNRRLLQTEEAAEHQRLTPQSAGWNLAGGTGVGEVPRHTEGVTMDASRSWLLVVAALLVAGCGPSTVGGAADRSTRVSPSISGQPPVSGESPVRAPSSCPVTRPSSPPFVPPAPPSGPLQTERDRFWHGTPALWTSPQTDGTWPMAADEKGHFDKSFWWRTGYDWRTEPEPKLTVVGHRLDDAAVHLVAARATNGFEPTMGPFMLTMIRVRTPGCWEITGSYRTAEVTFVVWIPSG